MAKNLADKRAKDTKWMTPKSILQPVRNYFGGAIPLDPATETWNPTNAVRFYTKADNGLARAWSGGVFVNPPYGKVFSQWCKKIGIESQRDQTLEILALFGCGSGRPGTKYYQEWIWQPALKAICYVKGRVAFLKTDGTPVKANTYPSCLMGYNVDQERFVRSFQHLGKILLTRVAEVQEPQG